MRNICLIALTAVCAAAHSQSAVERAAKDDELVFMRDQEPAMQKAFDKAAATLDEFLQKAKVPSADHTSFALKVAISQGKDTEYFWVNNFTEKDGAFEGEIGNEPRMVNTVKFGQRYRFPRSRVVDWTYIDKVQRKMVGNFTLCALLTKESKQDAQAMKKRFKLDCDWLQ
ncbi:DUF2314 domain-containing protein [Roseateles asaccharophilus]|uniref:Uncharacterized protein YegJ (DUF2314 family) n=1 Tax=Roseateles asaccharophilus TaxID=582607 RepID=A0ABU2ADL1_9BURK|nr:DUF2314 domain-containing protein [Roseateles asaccharophilus]MDR7335301.1 uncharacterized protein YegJ (DUF2314 family) [Roseateles asaccharophilus]